LRGQKCETGDDDDAVYWHRNFDDPLTIVKCVTFVLKQLAISAHLTMNLEVGLAGAVFRRLLGHLTKEQHGQEIWGECKNKGAHTRTCIEDMLKKMTKQHKQAVVLLFSVGFGGWVQVHLALVPVGCENADVLRLDRALANLV
jgi:hypothetical protein